MKPSLFRSITNNLFIKDAFYQKIKRYFLGLIMLCVTFGLIGRFEPDGIEINVKQSPQISLHESIVAIYQSASIKQLGRLHISNPTIIQMSLFPDSLLGIDLITLLSICIGSFIIILIIPKLKEKTLFRNDISNLIRILGFLILFHSAFSIYRMVVYIPNEIGILTNHEYEAQSIFPIFVYAEAYLALVVIAISYMYDRGVQLQEELDLTV